MAWGAGAPGALAFSPSRIWAKNGGNTIGEANLDGTAVNQSLITGASGPVGVPVSVPVATIRSASRPPFATTPQQSVSGPLTLTLTNNGQRSLALSGLPFVGADGGDFLVGADTCIAATRHAASPARSKGSDKTDLIENDDRASQQPIAASFGAAVQYRGFTH